MRRLYIWIYDMSRHFGWERPMWHFGRKLELSTLEISCDIAAAEGRRRFDDGEW